MHFKILPSRQTANHETPFRGTWQTCHAGSCLNEILTARIRRICGSCVCLFLTLLVLLYIILLGFSRILPCPHHFSVVAFAPLNSRPCIDDPLSHMLSRTPPDTSPQISLNNHCHQPHSLSSVFTIYAHGLSTRWQSYFPYSCPTCWSNVNKWLTKISFYKLSI
jgi:hypothetical protein